MIQGHQALGILYFVPRFPKAAPALVGAELRLYALEAPGRPPSPTERCQSAQRYTKQSAERHGSGFLNAGGYLAASLTTCVLGGQKGMRVTSPASQTPLWESGR